MTKKSLRVINFLYLDQQHYEKIRDYRNQDYIREASLNNKIITKAEHQNYKKLLEKKDKYFAYLITCDNIDYAVITLKKEEENTYTSGEYLINESFKFEGGGVALKYCILYLCNELKIKYLKYKIKYTNKRGLRAGNIAIPCEYKEYKGYFEETSEVMPYNDAKVVNAKPYKLFSKIYKIDKVLL